MEKVIQSNCKKDYNKVVCPLYIIVLCACTVPSVLNVRGAQGYGALCPTYSDRSLIQVSSALVEERKIDNELDMHKHWQLSQCACAGNHVSAAGQGH